MRRPGVRLLALIAILPALFLLSPPRASYACTADYPEEYFESYTVDVPPLPEGISVYTTFKDISRAVGDNDIAEFAYEDLYDLHKDRSSTSLSFMAVSNLTDKPLYLLADKDNEWVTPAANLAIIAPAGLVPVFVIESGEGLAFNRGLLIAFEDTYEQEVSGLAKDFTDEAYASLYYDEKLINIAVTFSFTYNVDYLADKAAIDKAMDDCQRAMDQGFSETVTPTPPYQLGDPTSPASQLVIPTLALVGGLAITGIALWLWQSRRANGE